VATTDEYYLILIYVDRFIYVFTATDEDNVGLAFFLDRDEPTTADASAPTSNLTAYGYNAFWKGGLGETFSGEIAGVEVNGADFAVGLSYNNGVNTFLSIRQFIHDAGVNYDFEEGDNERLSFRTVSETYTGLDFQYDPNSNHFWLVGCNTDGMHYMAVQPGVSGGNNILNTPSVQQYSETTTWDLDPTGEGCFLQMSEYVGSGANVHINAA
jgi:hypothetical protein